MTSSSVKVLNHDDRMIAALRHAQDVGQPKVGKKLTNNTICLVTRELKRVNFAVEYIVLAIDAEAKMSSHTFWTWCYVVGIQQMSDGRWDKMPPYALWGHPYRQLETALDDFWKRGEHDKS